MRAKKIRMMGQPCAAGLGNHNGVPCGPMAKLSDSAMMKQSVSTTDLLWPQFSCIFWLTKHLVRSKTLPLLSSLKTAREGGALQKKASHHPDASKESMCFECGCISCLTSCHKQSQTFPWWKATIFPKLAKNSRAVGGTSD